MEPAERAAYASEMTTAQGRLEVLRACIADDDTALAKVLQTCQEQPCASAKDLRTVQALEAQIRFECDTIADEDRATKVKDLLATARNAFADLVAASKQAGKDITAARKAREKAAQQRQKRGSGAAESEATPKKARPSSGRAIFEHGPLMAAAMTVVSPGAPKEAFDFSKPFVVPLSAKPGGECPIPEATAAMESFHAAWSTSAERMRAGRAACPIQDAAVEHAVRAHLQAACAAPSTLAVVDLPPAWNSALAPSMYAIRQGLETAYNEAEFLPCVRLQTQGTRTVVLTAALSLHSAVTADSASLGTDAGSPLKQRLWSLLLNVGAAALDAFTKQHQVVHGTLGPCDLLYVPGGWVLAEVTGSNVDAFGFKMGLLLADDAGLAQRLETLAGHGGFGNAGTSEAGKAAAAIAALGQAARAAVVAPPASAQNNQGAAHDQSLPPKTGLGPPKTDPEPEVEGQGDGQAPATESPAGSHDE